MPTLLLCLAGPMQSWGISSRFTDRDTGKEPSKSGVLGLLAAALGIDREDWSSLEPLTHLKMGVRHDRAGTPMRDFQTAGCAASDSIIRANGSQATDGGVVSVRHYIADAAFLVGLQDEKRATLEELQNALRNPRWTLFLGRKSYVPSEPIWIPEGIQESPLREVLARWPWLGTRRKWEKYPERILVSTESTDESGTLKMDQPASSFAERRFRSRFVRSEWIPFPQEDANVSS